MTGHCVDNSVSIPLAMAYCNRQHVAVTAGPVRYRTRLEPIPVLLICFYSCVSMGHSLTSVRLLHLQFSTKTSDCNFPIGRCLGG